MSGPISTALAAAFERDPFPARPGVPGLSPLGSRLLIMNGNIGSGLVPGIEAREPAVEGEVMRDPLPDPPPPPGNGGNR